MCVFTVGTNEVKRVLERHLKRSNQKRRPAGQQSKQWNSEIANQAITFHSQSVSPSVNSKVSWQQRKPVLDFSWLDFAFGMASPSNAFSKRTKAKTKSWLAKQVYGDVDYVAVVTFWFSFLNASKLPLYEVMLFCWSAYLMVRRKPTT